MNGGAEGLFHPVKRARENGALVRILSGRGATGALKKMGLAPDTVLPDGKASKQCRNEMNDFKPDTVLTDAPKQDEEDLRTPQQVLWATALARDIKSVGLVTGWDNLLERFSDLDPDESGVMRLVSGSVLRIPSVIALPGEEARKELSQAGIPERRLVVTGNPYYENVQSEAATLSPETRKILLEKPVFAAFSEDGKLIVFMSDSVDSYPDIGFTESSVLRQFLEAIDGLAEADGMKIQVVVRPHPYRNKDAMEAFAAVDTPHIAKVLHNPGGDPENEYKIEELIKAADIVAGTFNNPLITAAVMGVPVIQFLPGMDKKYGFQEFLAREGSAARLDDTSQLRDTIRRVLSGNFRLKPLGAVEGATDRVIEQL